jgi:tetratricopeptide (TPR) repeat protein
VALHDLAELYRLTARFEQAEGLYLQSLALLEKSPGPGDPRFATAVNNLGVLYQTQGRYDQAEALHRSALAAQERALGPSHPGVAVTLGQLGQLYDARGLYAEAEGAFRRRAGGTPRRPPWRPAPERSGPRPGRSADPVRGTPQPR